MLVHAVALTLLPQASAGQPTTTLISARGAVGPRISSNGQWVVFWSSDPALVPGDTNGVSDVFLHDRVTRTTSRVNVGPGGTQANRIGEWPAVSGDGRYIAFNSEATNLVPGDTNGTSDVFVHDRLTGVTTRVSVTSGGGQANGASGVPAISADGRFVAFHSTSRNLAPGDGLARQVFVHDRQTGMTTRVSTGPGGVVANSDTAFAKISDDGRWVSFGSAASNLVPADTNNAVDAFVFDRQTGTTTRVSVGSGGVQGNNDAGPAVISADGRSLVFWSAANNLVPGDTNNNPDVFVHDRVTGATTRVSVSSAGVQGASGSGVGFTEGDYSISADGRWVAFSSFADLVAGTPLGAHVFLHDRRTATTIRVAAGRFPSISADGRFVALDASSLGGVLVYDRGDAGSPPNAPASLVASVLGSRIDLSWAAPVDGERPTSYVLEAGSAAGAIDLANFDTRSPSVSFTASGIAQGTYFVRVRARNAGGTSGPSNEIQLTIGSQPGCSPPGPPSGLSGTVSGAIAALAWMASNGPLTTYVVEAGSSSGLSNLAQFETGDTRNSIAGTGPRGTYYVRVRARNACGTSAPSNEIVLAIP